MICILKDNLGHLEHWVRVARILRKHPDEEVAVWEHLVQKNSLSVKEGDRLAILAHGTEKYVGMGITQHGHEFEYDASLLKSEIKALEQQGKLPNIKRIELLSCKSGVGDKNSLAAKLAEGLKYRHTVWGYRDSAFSTPEGRNRATADPEQSDDGSFEKLLKENQDFANLWREFQQTVSELQNGTKTLSNALVRKVVADFNNFFGNPPDVESHASIEEGRLIVEKTSGKVFTKKHKEFTSGGLKGIKTQVV